MQDRPGVVLDMQRVDYVSSAGLRVLLKAAKIARQEGHRLALAGLTPQVQEVFDISGFTAIFTIYESRQRAIESLRRALAADCRRAAVHADAERELLAGARRVREEDLEVPGGAAQPGEACWRDGCSRRCCRLSC